VVVEDFNTSLSPRNRSSKNQQEMLELNDPIDLIDLADVYKVFHPATAQYAFSLSNP
jgi:hypothetical protein